MKTIQSPVTLNPESNQQVTANCSDLFPCMGLHSSGPWFVVVFGSPTLNGSLDPTHSPGISTTSTNGLPGSTVLD